MMEAGDWKLETRDLMLETGYRILDTEYWFWFIDLNIPEHRSGN